MSVHPKAQGIATYVQYEWRMVKAIAEKSPYTGEWVIKYALIDSFLMHARAIKDFLYGEDKAKFPDDVVAVHFFVDSSVWLRSRPPMGDYLRDNDKRLNKMIAHISYERPQWRGKSKGWQIGTIRAQLEPAWNAFHEMLPADRRAWFHAPRGPVSK